MVRITIVRHAQSAWNATGRWQGWADPPLTALGRSQAVVAGRRVRDDPPARIVTSDLRRAASSARIIASVARPGLAPDVDGGWREYRVGDWSGLTRPEIEARWPGELERWDAGDLAAPSGGEPRPDFDHRLLEALGRSAMGPGPVLVVSQGGAIRALARLLGAPPGHVGNLAGLVVEADPDPRLVGAADLIGNDPGDRAV